ncbi:dihydropteroate synthase [Phycisphaera mikurensis]|uniref:Dihydropteroate synthase n=1 Tax=Phycisphaera mikurensis (strain NBRC 102666 / KCTC 22515 / FYK2301M01) TaxID=1142394 RepID=I0IB50_PHYMF|nr:dihydropteroate synthase [Phycisphaera mikurensis]MBB6442989.1 dihydropteroate synthase [Phycisphaera mikurensis]BAM02488.1 dihydropteroate synthase [Phycisphaera mikurensis NBRC 102666]
MSDLPHGPPPPFRLMGILNATPDSFSDGGRFADAEAAVAAGLKMAGEGATILDVGGESTRPGAERVPAGEQIRRVVPVIRGLAEALPRGGPSVTISVDTTRAAVAEAAADAGATLLNDVSAGEDDPAMFGVAAERKLPMVLMHKRGEPAVMQRKPAYADVAAEVADHLRARAAAALAAGVREVWLDPGIGFGKTLAHNLTLLAALPRLVAEGHPVLLGASRKSFLAPLDPSAVSPDGRLPGSLAVAVLGLAAGVGVFRVHDVAAHRQALATAAAVAEAATQAGTGHRGTPPPNRI